MKAAELRAKSLAELQSELTQELRAQFNLRMQKGAGQLDKPSEFRKTRRNIARIRTIIKQKKAASDQPE